MPACLEHVELRVGGRRWRFSMVWSTSILPTSGTRPTPEPPALLGRARLRDRQPGGASGDEEAGGYAPDGRERRRHGGLIVRHLVLPDGAREPRVHAIRGEGLGPRHLRQPHVSVLPGPQGRQTTRDRPAARITRGSGSGLEPTMRQVSPTGGSRSSRRSVCRSRGRSWSLTSSRPTRRVQFVLALELATSAPPVDMQRPSGTYYMRRDQQCPAATR